MCILLKNVSKTFKNQKRGHAALKGVNLEIPKGEIFGIIGSSGSGKSTLVRCLTGLEEIDEGEIIVCGSLISSRRKQELRSARKKFGMIFQHFNLFFSQTVLENVSFPLFLDKVERKEREDKALELLKLVGLEKKKEAYPSQLSGGEKQRVAIARALATSPEVLFSDEATSALDPASKQAIFSLLLDLNKRLNLTIIFITHEMEAVKHMCTSVAVLDHGSIVEKGTVEEVFLSPKQPATLKLLTELHPTDLFETERNFSNLYRLSFKGESANRPLLSSMIKQFDISVNILQGSIDALRTTKVGTLIVEIAGSEMEGALNYLKQEGVFCEQLQAGERHV